MGGSYTFFSGLQKSDKPNSGLHRVQKRKNSEIPIILILEMGGRGYGLMAGCWAGARFFKPGARQSR